MKAKIEKKDLIVLSDIFVSFLTINKIEINKVYENLEVGRTYNNVEFDELLKTNLKVKCVWTSVQLYN